MTKAFLHGRTEAIRTVQPESVAFVKVSLIVHLLHPSLACRQTFCSDSATPAQKVKALRDACKRHVDLTRECSKGLGQDRSAYMDPSIVSADFRSTATCTPCGRSFKGTYTQPKHHPHICRMDQLNPMGLDRRSSQSRPYSLIPATTCLERASCRPVTVATQLSDCSALDPSLRMGMV